MNILNIFLIQFEKEKNSKFNSLTDHGNPAIRKSNFLFGNLAFVELFVDHHLFCF
jgi:hypothetical protein